MRDGMTEWTDPLDRARGGRSLMDREFPRSCRMRAKAGMGLAYGSMACARMTMVALGPQTKTIESRMAGGDRNGF